jgi:hypothetical protein
MLDSRFFLAPPRAYFRADGLKRIFDALPSSAKRPWHFWLPVIGLYTGARIGEPAALYVPNVPSNAPC